jgi:tetratricopeptide (TPR) repeat protein
MMIFRLWILLCFLPTSSAFASTALLPPELEAFRNEGVDALFNMNYEEARTTFQKMVDLDPQHPAGHIYMANTTWLGHLAQLRRLQTNIYNRGNSFFSKTEDTVDPKVDKAFRQEIEKGISLCEKQLKVRTNDIPSLYYLGVAKNIVAGYEATVKRSFLPALRNGSKGVGLHREIMKKDPSCIDAQLSVGMYNYVVGSLPLAVKMLVFLGGVRGSKTDGIAMLERVAREGNYAKDEGKVLLVMLYNREKRIADALKTLNQLVERYSENSLFRLERAVTLGQLRKFNESASGFELLLHDVQASSYIPDLIHYQYGTMLSDADRWQNSYEQFVAAYNSKKAPPALATLAHLNAGKSMDRLGKRDQAVSEYQMVLKRKDVFDSHDLAKKYLKKPYSGSSD